MHAKSAPLSIVLIACLALIAAPLLAQETGAASATEKSKDQLAQGTAAAMNEEKLPAGSKVFIAPMAGGFETCLTAGLQQKKVPLVIMADRTKADFEITGIAESEKAGWAKMLFMNSGQSAEQASIKIVNLQSGSTVFAYSVNKGNSARGKQSAGETCAKHIKEKIEGKQ